MIVAEVYAILMIALVGVLGGAKNAFRALRVRLVPARAFVVAFGIFAVAVIVGNLAYALAGAGDALVKSYLLIGTDGGRPCLAGHRPCRRSVHDRAGLGCGRLDQRRGGVSGL